MGRLPASQASGPRLPNSQDPRQGNALELPFSSATTTRSVLLSLSGRCCHVEPLNGVRGVTLETSLNRADAIGTPSRVVLHEVRCSLPVDVRRKSHRSLGIAQRSRPPSRESAESTQMSVMLTRRPPDTDRATSSSE